MESRETEGTNRQWGAIAAFVLFVCFLASNFFAIQSRLVEAYPVMEVRNGDERPPLSAAQERAVLSALSRAPLNQKLLNWWLVGQLSSREGLADETSAFAALGQLGYRSSWAQYNILIHRIEQGDLDRAVQRMDALLRRDKLTEQIWGLLLLLEQASDGRQALSNRLAFRPQWSNEYLSNSDLLQSQQSIAGRLALLTQLQGVYPTKKLYFSKAATRAMDLAAPDLAQSLMNLYYGSIDGLDADQPSALLTYTPNPETTDRNRFPHEWRMGRNRHIDVKAIPVNGLSLAIDWDGTSNPIFASRYVDQSSPFLGETYALRPTPGDEGDFELIDVRLTCPVGRMTISTRSVDQVSFSVPNTLPCEAPRLDIYGIPRVISGDITMTVSLSRVER